VSALEAISVVIPARNEEALVGACLRSVLDAVRFARRKDGDLPSVDILLVADSCSDATSSLARAHPGVSVETVGFASVGAARSFGVATVLRRASVDPSRHWIANTDADSVVPENWITEQIAHADEGYQLMIGTVRPDMADLTDEQRDAWLRTHRSGEAIGHVHGANLGVRGDAYLAAGGFLNQTEHEDNDLVRRLLASGAAAIATDRCEVVTSGRRWGRTPGGYAGYLREQLIPAGATRPLETKEA
jgi:glycosyltransferase involved in cell wall biosynthesis